MPRAGLAVILGALLFLASCAPAALPERATEPEPSPPRKDQLVLRPASFADLPISAVASISTIAATSIRPATTITDIDGKCRPMILR